jgi:hypothetical protein
MSVGTEISKMTYSPPTSHILSGMNETTKFLFLLFSIWQLGLSDSTVVSEELDFLLGSCFPRRKKQKLPNPTKVRSRIGTVSFPPNCRGQSNSQHQSRFKVRRDKLHPFK